MPTPAYRGTLTLAVPASAGSYAADAFGALGPAVQGYNPPGSKAIMSLTVTVVALPASSQIEVWLLDPTAFDPTNIANYFNSGTVYTATGQVTTPWASVPGMLLRAKSGGTSGPATVIYAALG